MEKQYAVYVLASKWHGTLYIGVTNNLLKRTWQHRNGMIAGFTKKYNVHRLVYFEMYEYIHDALKREKNLKEWKRQWKVDLIEENNKSWRDLFDEIAA